MAQPTTSSGSDARALALATLSFFVSFAAWGLMGGLAPVFADLYDLTASQTALLVAVPVLLGSLARLPMGMLTDRFGGRAVFTLLLVASAAAAVVVPSTWSYPSLLVAAFFIGMAGSSFAVGAAFVSRWTPPARQGTALGVYGLGTLGQSLAVFGAPVIAARFGWPNVFYGIGLILVAWAVVYVSMARNPPRPASLAGVGAMVAVLRGSPTAWLLGAFYFLTFGGFVAFSIYLPTLLRSQFGLSPADAGFRAAGFVVLATAMRPVGGWLADRIGGAQVLSWVFGGTALFAMLLAWPSMVPFTVGALGCAALMGLGNGAVFKLVPEHFPQQTGTVTGLVGALGGLGGFFPPLLLGVFHDTLGVTWPGFALLSATALALRVANQRVFRPSDVAWREALPMPAQQAVTRVAAAAWATPGDAAARRRHRRRLAQAAALRCRARRLHLRDAVCDVRHHVSVRHVAQPAADAHVLAARLGGVLHAPQARGESRDARSSRRPGVRRQPVHLPARPAARPRAHGSSCGAASLAAAITFPLVWGWIHFETVPGNLELYRAFVFGVPTQDFPVESAVAFVLFHGLVWSSFLVIAGVMLAFRRRMIDHGAVAVQQFGQDILPLLLLFAISVTGLMLTASYTWMKGYAYDFLAILHAVTVIVTLLWLPFGKLFHIFQRPAQLGVSFYKDAGARGEQARCRRCGQPYASAMMVRD